MKIRYQDTNNDNRITVEEIAAVYVEEDEVGYTLNMCDIFDDGGWFEIRHLPLPEAEMLRDKFFMQDAVDLMAYNVIYCENDDEDEDADEEYDDAE